MVIKSSLLLGRLWPANWRYHTRMKAVGFLFTLPVLVFFLVFNVYPILSAVVISFFEFDLFGPHDLGRAGKLSKPGGQ